MSRNITDQQILSDPFQAAIIANRIDAVVKEMTNTLLRTGRSAVIASARDFSCSLTTADNQLLSVADGLPVHTFSSHMQTASLQEFHGDDLREGDAYLHNDPYMGNTHAADQTVLVPIFVDGEHLFTAVAKAHQADIGNSIPTTYHATATDVYNEGAMIFPCVRLQRDEKMNDDLIRMCYCRIRVPDVWYGDLLAALGAARIAERRMKALCDSYGKETIKNFVREWFDYSEFVLRQEIAKMPASTVSQTGHHDPLPPVLPDGIEVKVTVDIDPVAKEICVDLTESADCVDAGLNQTMASSTNHAICGVFNCLNAEVPINSGSLRCIKVKLREGCVAGIPLFPHSCSVATTNIGDRIVNATQSAIAKIGKGFGLAEGGVGSNSGAAVISGKDKRFGDRLFVNQLVIGPCGGPGGPVADGWVNYGLPIVGGVIFFDSVEVSELKYPVFFERYACISGSGGAGEYRGAPSVDIQYSARYGEIDIAMFCDGQFFPAKGVHGGQDGRAGRTYLIHEGEASRVASIGMLRLQTGDSIQGVTASGAGYGNSLDRDPERVRKDVREGWETEQRALDVYGVVLDASSDGLDFIVNLEKTREQREVLATN